MNLYLQAIAQTESSTLSALTKEGEFICFFLEDGYREKKVPGETRIPPGKYRILQRRHGGFFTQYKKRWGHTFVPELENVPGFSDILIHAGNTKEDTRGCLLPGMTAIHATFPEPEFAVQQSTTAYLALYDILQAAFASGQDVFFRVARSINFEEV